MMLFAETLEMRIPACFLSLSLSLSPHTITFKHRKQKPLRHIKVTAFSLRLARSHGQANAISLKAAPHNQPKPQP